MMAQQLKPTTIAVVGASTPAGQALVKELARGQLTVLDPLLHEIVGNQAQERLTPEAQALKPLRPVELRLLGCSKPDSVFQAAWDVITGESSADSHATAAMTWNCQEALDPVIETAMYLSHGAIDLTVTVKGLSDLFTGADFIFILGEDAFLSEKPMKANEDYEDEEDEDEDDYEDRWQAQCRRYLDYARALNACAPAHARVVVEEEDSVGMAELLSQRVTAISPEQITVSARYEENVVKVALGRATGQPSGVIENVVLWGTPQVGLESAWGLMPEEREERAQAKATMDKNWGKRLKALKPLTRNNAAPRYSLEKALAAIGVDPEFVCDMYMNSDKWQVDPRYAQVKGTDAEGLPLPIWPNFEGKAVGSTHAESRRYLLEKLHYSVYYRTPRYKTDPSIFEERARALVQYMHDWVYGCSDDFVSMVVPSKGEYGFAKGCYFSLPCELTFDGVENPWQGATYRVVPNLKTASSDQRTFLAMLSYSRHLDFEKLLNVTKDWP